jgi:ATP-dependent Lon protease
MTNPSPWLPLFPLEWVLFPGGSLPLHIFEPRYRKLIHDCLEHQREFGVILVQNNQIAEVGCTTRIVEVVKRYDDGRLDIVTEGRRRFEVLFQNHEEEVLRAEVSFFDDEGEEDPTELKRLLEAVRSLYTKIVLTVAQPNMGLNLVEAQPPRLAFAIAESLTLPLEVCQNLLALRSETNRLRELDTYLQDIYPKIERLERAQAKSGGNGHLAQ